MTFIGKKIPYFAFLIVYKKIVFKKLISLKIIIQNTFFSKRIALQYYTKNYARELKKKLKSFDDIATNNDNAKLVWLRSHFDMD